MWKRWLVVGLLLVVTGLNVRFFVSRWADAPLKPLAGIVSQAYLLATVSGFCAAAVVLSIVGLAWRRRWGLAGALGVLSGGLVSVMYKEPLFAWLFVPVRDFAIAGAVFALVCLQMRENRGASSDSGLGRSFFILALASFNFFLLCGPFTTHLPSYVQDGIELPFGFKFFYYGSIHSDLSVVSIILRNIINLLFPDPSINATAISSMIYVAVGLALCGVALQMMYGWVWAWVFIVLAWTDRWLFASAISNSILGHPILSTAFAVFMCTWALTRKPTELSWKETWILACINCLGLFFNLYSYSAARMPWLLGCGITAAILLFRRAVPFTRDGLGKVAIAVVPSILLLVAIWATFFERDTERFKSQIFISPRMTNIIKDVNDYPKKVYPIRDNDMPIWWGTGRPEGENVSVYWRRSPGEILEKVSSMMREISVSPPIPPLLLVLAALGVLVGLTSAHPARRWFTAVISIMGMLSFATFVFAQDASAYRRGVPTNLLVLVAIVNLLAIKARSGWLQGLAICGGIALAVVKAPAELNVLTDQSFFSPVCISCHGQMNIRDLVADPRYHSIRDKPIYVYTKGRGTSAAVAQCASSAINSYEFKNLTPNARELVLREGEKLDVSFSALRSGDTLVVLCTLGSLHDAEMKEICANNPPFGKLQGSYPEVVQNISSWWVVIERE